MNHVPLPYPLKSKQAFFIRGWGKVVYQQHKKAATIYEDEEEKKIIKILFDTIRTYLNEKTIVNENKTK